MHKNIVLNILWLQHTMKFVNILYAVVDIFTALHGMQMRSSDENSVRPSVCPSHA